MKEILVGISGGMDSAIAVKLLQNNGYKVTGVFFKMLADKDSSQSAKAVAKQLNIPFLEKDLSRVFKKNIIDNFLMSYQKGITPNPCVLCNPQIKFRYLLQLAKKLNIDLVATGHYARVQLNKNGSYNLKKGVDQSKDQSYFLYRLKNDDLKKIIFPLGKLFKKDLKEKLTVYNLQINKTESQDVCFLQEYKKLDIFLKKYLPKGSFTTGKIINERGKVVGEHCGLISYTVGQRKGLNINGGPFYVVAKDFKNNILKVSRNRLDKNLFTKNIIFNQVNWLTDKPQKNKEYSIKIRYQMPTIQAKIFKQAKGRWLVKTKQSLWAMAKGQSLVVYDKETVIGGGIIV